MELHIVEHEWEEDNSIVEWICVDPDTARALQDNVQLYKLYDNNTEAAILEGEEGNSLEEVIAEGFDISFEETWGWREVWEEEMKQPYRQNDKRTFLQWAESKIKNEYL